MAGQRARAMTPELLASVQTCPDIPQHTWYIIAAATLCILNRPEEIPMVYQYALETESRSASEKLRVSRRMRDALIKVAAVGGMPKTINAMTELAKVTPEDLVDRPMDALPTSRTGDLVHVPAPMVLRRGWSFFDKVYGKVAARVKSQLEHCGTPDLSLMVQLVYGYIISNTDTLNSAETSFVMMAGLIPQDVNPQLKGHLKGALNGGASKTQVMEVRSVVIRICQAAGMVMLGEHDVGSWGWRTEVAGL